ncbi:MAG: 30S ribosomal protein S12 methylthiotransferase RimO [Clostridium sp.]|nr:30S ribosomal protein S12 methylthiotransferase RimO [Clostridium sp.]
MKILCVSLGCDKNLVDSEMMMGLLRREGYSFTDDETEADIIVINTCAFIDAAKEESINTILELAEMKREGRCRALIVAGCMAERYKEEVLREIPEVDAILGTNSCGEIASVIDRVFAGEEKVTAFRDLSEAAEDSGERFVSAGGYYSFLKIAEGCNKRCTYCIIPFLRGPYRSVPIVRLLSEAKKLAEQGVKELILVAQETTLYGVDLTGKKLLPMLLRKLSGIEGIEWIRLQYCYPEEIDDELTEAIATLPKVLHYLDIPVQHASDRILRRMGRKTTQAEIRQRIARIRERIPDICLRTTLISGFPGETEEDHEELLDFVNDMEFERLGVFAYSREEGTPAAEWPDQVPDDVKEERRDEIMELQQEIAFEKAASLAGTRLDVIIEGRIPEEGLYVGRTYMDAPNVDSQIYIRSDLDLISGTIVRAVVTDSVEYDLKGVIEDEFTE